MSRHNVDALPFRCETCQLGQSAMQHRGLIMISHGVPSHFGTADICVAGAGPVGLAVALQCAQAGLKVILVHENDKTKGGCEFATLFVATPQELVNDGIYRYTGLQVEPRHAFALFRLFVI